MLSTSLRAKLRCWRFALALLLVVAWAPPARALELRVATWNVFDLPRPFFSVASRLRCARMVDALAAAISLPDVDAIVLTELYVPADRAVLLAALATHGFVHHTKLQSPHLIDKVRYAGTVIASRWPIERSVSMTFEGACHGLDCLATKGAVMATLRVEKGAPPRQVHVVGAHFYLGQQGAYVHLRAEQARALNAWLVAQPIAPREPLLLAGDLNAPWSGDAPHLLAALRGFPVVPSGALDHTFVGDEHALAGSPRSGAKERCRKVRGQRPANAQRHRKWIDYVWAIGPGARPASGTLTAFEPATTRYPIARDAQGACCTTALSDHHVVVGHYRFD